MARPTDWDILDLDHDPTPGDPQRVKDISGVMRGIGDDAERAARDVRGLAGDDAVMGWIGASGDAFKTHIGKFPSQLDKVATSHHLCADALLEFGNTLDSVQSQADRALVQARPLHDQVQRLQAQLASAHTDLTSAGKGVTAAQAAATVDPTSVQNAIRTQSTAQSAVDSLNSQLSGPASQLEALKKLAASAESLRHTAEDTARTKINTATDAGIPPDSFWHKLGHLAGELWHGLVIVAKIVSFVGAIVLMVVGGPIWLIVAVVVAGVIILADTLYKYSQGKASLWDVGLAVLSCIPITKGFTSMAAVADAFRAGGMLGAGLHIAGAIGGAAKDLVVGMAGLLRSGGGMLHGLFTDGDELTRAMTWTRREMLPTSKPLKFEEMSPKARQLFKALEAGNGILDIRSGEVSVQHLSDLTSYANKEFAVLQGPGGDLKLFLGEATGTTRPRALRAAGYQFIVHSHPETGMPGIEDVYGRHSMMDDLANKAKEATHHIEVVVSKNGDARFFDDHGFVDPPGGQKFAPGGPVNDWGHIVSVLGI